MVTQSTHRQGELTVCKECIWEKSEIFWKTATHSWATEIHPDASRWLPKSLMNINMNFDVCYTV